MAESFEEGANISEVARRHGVSRGLLTVWRGHVTAMAGKAPSFVPIQIGAESGIGVECVKKSPATESQESHAAFDHGIGRTSAAIDDADFAEDVADPEDLDHETLAAPIDGTDANVARSADHGIYGIRFITLGEDL